MTPFIFIAVALTSMLLFYYGTGKNKKLLIIFASIQLVIGLVAGTGIFLEKPHLFPLLILVTAAFVIYSLITIDRQKINETVLLSVHTLRIPVEMILFQLYLDKKIPELMTFSGWNFDIVIGITAALLLIYVLLGKKPVSKRLMMAWNVAGLVFLFTIVTLSILSSPLMIQQLAFDQPNIAVASVPYCFLPTCVVPVVLMSHILLLQKNSAKSNTTI